MMLTLSHTPMSDVTVGRSSKRVLTATHMPPITGSTSGRVLSPTHTLGMAILSPHNGSCTGNIISTSFFASLLFPLTVLHTYSIYIFSLPCGHIVTATQSDDNSQNVTNIHALVEVPISLQYIHNAKDSAFPP